jgi:hypothetical protein
MGRPCSDTSQITAKQSTSCSGNFRAAENHCRRLLWVGQRRTQATLRRGLAALGEPVVKGLRFVCTDVRRPYLNVGAAKAGQALHVLDRFHITSPLNQAVDEVRRAESRRLRGRPVAQKLKKMRWNQREWHSGRGFDFTQRMVHRLAEDYHLATRDECLRARGLSHGFGGSVADQVGGIHATEQKKQFRVFVELGSDTVKGRGYMFAQVEHGNLQKSSRRKFGLGLILHPTA